MYRRGGGSFVTIAHYHYGVSMPYCVITFFNEELSHLDDVRMRICDSLQQKGTLGRPALMSDSQTL